jgi:hypothetical protein
MNSRLPPLCFRVISVFRGLNVLCAFCAFWRQFLRTIAAQKGVAFAPACWQFPPVNR